VDTFEAVAVTAIALLPGALYVWGFERQVGRWGIGLSDRVLRFFGTSAFIHALMAPVTYWLWERSRNGTPVSIWLWAGAVAYVAGPFVAGSVVGRALVRGKGWAALLTGPNPAPRAWDHFFASAPDGWVRLCLKSGTWVAGLYSTAGGRRSYASGYPEAQDLLLMDTVLVDPETGDIVLVNGSPARRGISLLIRWEEVELMEFTELEG
jgi:hypothetical protein